MSKIVITADGATTLARLYEGKKVVKRAEAKCAPSDTFDFAIGAKLAYDRLMSAADDKPLSTARKYYNGKVICIAKTYKDSIPLPDFTVGKVYDVVNGVITDDVGWTSPPRNSLRHLCVGMGNTFCALVSRPAKVGEWVYMVNDMSGDLLPETIHKCTAPGIFDGMWFCTVSSNYLVLDGYNGEHEPGKRPYKVGAVVRLVSERPNDWNCDGYMDGYLGKKVKITAIDGSGFKFNNSRDWSFLLSSIYRLVKAADE